MKIGEIRSAKKRKEKNFPPLGFEPRTFGLERAGKVYIIIGGLYLPKKITKIHQNAYENRRNQMSLKKRKEKNIPRRGSNHVPLGWGEREIQTVIKS